MCFRAVLCLWWPDLWATGLLYQPRKRHQIMLRYILFVITYFHAILFAEIFYGSHQRLQGIGPQ